MNTFHKHARKFLAACVFIILTSCGGGSGSQSTISDNTTTVPTVRPIQSGSVVADTTAIDVKYIQGDEQATIKSADVVSNLTKIITLEGVDLNNLPENFFLSYFTDNNLTSNHLTVFFEQIDSKRLRARFQPLTGLAPGQYSGKLQLIACLVKDGSEECEKQLDGSPSAEMSYKITVFPRLLLGDLYVSTVYANQGSSNPIMGVTLIGGAVSKDDLVAQITYSENARNWLSLTKTDTGYTYSVIAQNASIGSHTATIKVTSQASKQSVVKTIELIVGANSFTGFQTARSIEINDQTVVQDLKSEIVVNINDNSLSIPWKATANVPWILLDKYTGLSGETLTYRISPAYVATMPTETNFSLLGSSGIITISNESTFTIAPLNILVEAHRLTSELSSISSAPIPINTPGYLIYFAGKNLFDGTVFVTSGPSPLTIQRDYFGRGVIQTVPTVAGIYTVSTKNALGISTQPVSITFLANSLHTQSFIASPNYKRSMAYDQTRDTLYVVDKTNSQLKRFNHRNGIWSITQLSIANISDLGLSQDRNRLYVSRTTGLLNRVNATNLTIENTYIHGRPFPEYKPLSQNLPVTGVFQDWVTLLPSASQTTETGFNGIMAFSSLDNSFQPVSGYGYKTERGGWFSRSNNPDLAFFTQARPRDDGFGDYVGLLYNNNMIPSAYHVAYGPMPPFDTLDVGLTSNEYLFGLNDRKRFTSVYGYSAELPALPTEYRTVGSVVSPDWQYVYLLTYPIAAINGDLQTALKPRVYVFQITSGTLPEVSLLPSYFELDGFPTCRRASDVSCLLDTLSSVTMDGRTLFFAGDKGIAIVPVPPQFRSGAVSMIKTAQSRSPDTFGARDRFPNLKNSIRYIRR